MRVRSMAVLFGGVLAGLGTMGGMPCQGCPAEEAPYSQTSSLDCASALGFLKAEPGIAFADAAGSAIVVTEGDASVQASMVDDAGVHATGDDAGLPLSVATCVRACGSRYAVGCRLLSGAAVDARYCAGACCFQLDCDYEAQPAMCGGGRRTDGVHVRPTERGQGVGRYFAVCAALEGASVRSFHRLRAELRRHRAPRSLLRACSRAARDERRHTRAMDALALRHHARRGPHDEAPLRARSLEAIAIENAREGCVFETFGALLATWQARHAVAADVRTVTRRIARDETRHACLAWAMAAWLEARLDGAARARVSAARRDAVTALVATLGAAPDGALVAAGLQPPAPLRQAMARALMQRLRA